MQPLSGWPMTQRAMVRGVMTDIDDTLTADGRIEPAALEALGALRAQGFALIAITGRPAGWSAPFAAAWPLDALVAENGAVAFVRTPGASHPEKIYQQDADTRARNHIRMQAVAAQILQHVPEARLAADSAGRECDIAIDHSEFHTLPTAAIEQVVAIMRAAGMHATVSSIHINGWYGEHDKWQGAHWILRTLRGQELDEQLAQWVYIGDSTNDERMFEHFIHSVGVANIARFAPRMQHLPRYVSTQPRGQGFAELAAQLIEARAAQPR
ncbi:HAD family phosphatase [Corticibacter populi]|uniref:HAD family phosphatase n=1 Tax=Corticibacter populi TaxID=1550736 RepID=A0A3M6QU13_9BURK|nr:HAD family phosphatase [Corticibacter populi]